MAPVDRSRDLRGACLGGVRGHRALRPQRRLTSSRHHTTPPWRRTTRAWRAGVSVVRPYPKPPGTLNCCSCTLENRSTGAGGGLSASAFQPQSLRVAGGGAAHGGAPPCFHPPGSDHTTGPAMPRHQCQRLAGTLVSASPRALTGWPARERHAHSPFKSVSNPRVHKMSISGHGL